MGKNNFIFINFNTLQFDNVFKTQVLNWINIYDKYGIHFDLVMFKSVKKIFKKDIEEKDYLNKNFHNKLYFRYLLSHKTPFSVFLNFLSFLSIILKYLKKDKIIIQIRSPFYYNSLLLLKKFFGKKIKIIFDSRGAVAEEYKYVTSQNNDFNKNTYQGIINSEIEMAKISDIIFCVSHALKNYHLKNNPALNNIKFFISPCNADPNLFFYSEKIRNEYRKKLNIPDTKKVIVYSGAFAAPWHIPNIIFKLFSKLERSDKFFFLILTNDTKIAKNYLSKYKINDNNYLLLSVKNSEVNNYLNASDLAILLRENLPINNVASPSKFAEYMMSGLPIIISENIGDFSDFIKNHSNGTIIPIDFTQKHIEQIIEFSEKKIDRVSISKLGNKYFSKQANIDDKIKKYKELIR